MATTSLATNAKGPGRTLPWAGAFPLLPFMNPFFDVVREINSTLPRHKRMRVVLGDAPLDFAQMSNDPGLALTKFLTSRSAPVSPTREAALAASVHAVIAKGRRGLVIAGSGHLRQGGLPGTARHLID